MPDEGSIVLVHLVPNELGALREMANDLYARAEALGTDLRLFMRQVEHQPQLAEPLMWMLRQAYHGSETSAGWMAEIVTHKIWDAPEALLRETKAEEQT